MNRKKNPKSNIMELWKPENSLSLSLPFCIFTSLSLSFYFCCWILKIFFQYNFKHKRNESWMKWMDQRQKQKKKIFSQIKYTERDYSWKHFPKWWKYRRYFFRILFEPEQQPNQTTKKNFNQFYRLALYIGCSSYLYRYTLFCSVLFLATFFFCRIWIEWKKKKKEKQQRRRRRRMMMMMIITITIINNIAVCMYVCIAKATQSFLWMMMMMIEKRKMQQQH